MSFIPKDRTRILQLAEILLIVLLASVPLFMTFPYRINIFLSWEGAYRISNGEIPFKDFGSPLGGMYWVIPAMFFKIFGAKLITLVKAQVFINILSGLAFRSILRSLKVQPGIRFVAVLVYCLSYSFFNFWPWYNHSVIVYEFIALAFLLKGFDAGRPGRQLSLLALAGLFTVCSFFTKQDAGGMALLLGLALAGYLALAHRERKPLLIYLGSVIVSFGLVFVVVGGSGFRYWFNHGQAPHSARISLFDIADEFLIASDWIKFYLFLIIFLVAIRFRGWKQLWSSRTEMLFLLLTLGILCEAAIFQVTSYTPPDNNIFFHSFAIVFILSGIASFAWPDTGKNWVLGLLTVGVLIWWSGTLWKYVQAPAAKMFAKRETGTSATGENVVNRKTFFVKGGEDTVIDNSRDGWVELKGMPAFEKILVPRSTADGIGRVSALPVMRKPGVKVLNMTELTPLAATIPFSLEHSPEYPLWFHLGVGMFNKQAAMFEDRIAGNYYDIVMFEYIPTLNNFYPFRIRDSLQKHYRKIDEFGAPRRAQSKALIEVYAPK